MENKDNAVAEKGEDVNLNEYYYNHYLAQATNNPEQFGISGAAKYEHQRGLRQMNHYFDVNSMPTAIPTATNQLQSTRKAVVVKPTASQLRYYKEQKKKRQKIKNKWLYD